ncbi:SDR family NAD(P)-dependent oxidoreductase [Emcibacter sp.]|uniref:SDR family NAD(P)-dependent oxidoreductase n=1 Tax=Emcibacter sp. TaxID=1979954 RepID=UPI002AA6C480|nr:SDR family oxidoreductase [Emcibacter sp.]
MKLEGRVVLITGGAGGLGKASAKALAAQGAHVVVTDIAGDAAKAVAREIGGTGYAHDVSDEKVWSDIVSDVLERQGRIDVLLNAAGIEGDLKKGGLNTSLTEWHRVMGINLDGTFLGCRAVTPHMQERGTGSIINISSIVSFMGTPSALAYGASKAAVQQLTRSIALIGAQDGARVRCNSIHPGIIRTRMTDAIFAEFAQNSGMTPEEIEQAVCAEVPFGARGVPEDVAGMVTFLASDDSLYVTGSEFKVDGGWLLGNAG